MSFFDEHLVLLPWPNILRRSGLNFTYKPREVFWKKKIQKLKLKSGEKILEVGCGRGIFLDRLVREYQVKTSGIDIAHKAINQAQKESTYNHDLKVADTTSLPFADNSFDIVISFDTLEHIQDQKKAVGEMARVLKAGGRILIYTINSRQNFTWNQALSFLGIDIYKNVDHDPKLFVNPGWLERELEKGKVRVKKTVFFDAFFTLITDELIMIFLKLWQQIFGWEKTEKSGRMILWFLSLFSVLTTPILCFLDLPWTAFGYSNGFLIWGEKKT